MNNRKKIRKKYSEENLRISVKEHSKLNPKKKMSAKTPKKENL